MRRSTSEIIVGITTYNRPECIYQLTKRLKELKDVYIVVIDDASDMSIDAKYIDHLINNPKNNGKEKYWMTVNKLFYHSRKKSPKYYINLVDDLLPNDNFFDCIELFEKIDDPNKIAMHLANNGREQNWTNFKRISYNEDVYLTQTTESSFICLPKFIGQGVVKAINPDRWRVNPNLGSGVGAVMCRGWIKRKKNIYGVKRSLIHPNDNCSQSLMNPVERQQNPWKIL